MSLTNRVSDNENNKNDNKKEKQKIIKKLHTLIDSPTEDLSEQSEILWKIDIKSIKKQVEDIYQKDNLKSEHQVKFRIKLSSETNKKAEDELSRHINKCDFEKMKIIGQFNLGFIITQLNNDLFIIDQHASDEKYNYEQLQLNSIIESQKLIQPQLLELTVAGKSILTEFEHVFKKNGFIFENKFQSNGIEDVFLTTVPTCDKVVLGKSDIDEMINLLQEDSSLSLSCRPSKIRQIFASRACRKSTMIGKALSSNNMRKLINQMGEIDQPWNCPHGRPTMRHLVNLNLLSIE